MIAGLEEGCDDVRIDPERAGADPVQDRLDSIRELGDGRQAHHGRGSLETMGRTKRLIQVRTIPLTPLQIHQPLFEADQELPRLLIKHLAEPVVRTT